MAIQSGADALGLVGPMPSGPGIVDDVVAAAVVRIHTPAGGHLCLPAKHPSKELLLTNSGWGPTPFNWRMRYQQGRMLACGKPCPP